MNLHNIFIIYLPSLSNMNALTKCFLILLVADYLHRNYIFYFLRRVLLHYRGFRRHPTRTRLLVRKPVEYHVEHVQHVQYVHHVDEHVEYDVEHDDEHDDEHDEQHDEHVTDSIDKRNSQKSIFLSNPYDVLDNLPTETTLYTPLRFDDKLQYLPTLEDNMDIICKYGGFYDALLLHMYFPKKVNNIVITYGSLSYDQYSHAISFMTHYPSHDPVLSILLSLRKHGKLMILQTSPHFRIFRNVLTRNWSYYNVHHRHIFGTN